MDKKKILFVDDNPDFVKVIKTRLEANNYSVITISDAKEVFLMAEKEMPDIIIMDIVMPDMDGYQICKLLKQGKKTKNIPIILLTGKELEPQSIQERCSKLGIEGYLFKPIEAKELIAKIEEVTKDRYYTR